MSESTMYQLIGGALVVIGFVLMCVAYKHFCNLRKAYKESFKKDRFARGYNWAKSLSEKTSRKHTARMVIMDGSIFDKGAAAYLRGENLEHALVRELENNNLKLTYWC